MMDCVSLYVAYSLCTQVRSYCRGIVVRAVDSETRKKLQTDGDGKHALLFGPSSRTGDNCERLRKSSIQTSDPQSCIPVGARGAQDVRQSQTTESNACCLYRYCWRGALPRIFLFKFTCEGGTAQYYVSSQYMYKGEGRSTTIEHVKKQISGGTAYGMDML